MSMVGSVCYEHVCEYCRDQLRDLQTRVCSDYENGKIAAYYDVIRRFEGEE